MHGCGNDFIMIENTAGMIELTPEEVAHLCDRHKGIGADGVILVERRDGHYYMNYINSDGSPATMCGNGMRCTVEFLRHFGFIDDDEQETVIGSRAGDIPIENIREGSCTVRIGTPVFEPEKIPMILSDENQNPKDFEIEVFGKNYRCGCLFMGNPQLVVLADPDEIPFEEVGAYLESHPMFPEKINVNFVQPEDRHNVRLRTYERGAGPTLACGTGTSAAVCVLNELGLTDSQVKAKVPGGELEIEIRDGDVFMTGPAESVYTGSIDL